MFQYWHWWRRWRNGILLQFVFSFAPLVFEMSLYPAEGNPVGDDLKWHLHCEWQPWQMLHSIDVDNTAQYTRCAHKHALGLYTRFAKKVASSSSSFLWNIYWTQTNWDDPLLYFPEFKICRNTECSVVRQFWRVLQLLAVLILVTKNNDYFHTVSSFYCIRLEAKQSTVVPIFFFNKTNWFNKSCNWVLYTSEGKHTVGSMWFTQPASRSITTQHWLVTQKGWEEEN